MTNAKLQAIAVLIGALVVVSGVGFALSYEQVPEGHEGVEKHLGAVTGNTLEPGAHMKMPIVTTVQPVEVRPRTYTMSQTVGEGDKSRADAIAVKTVNGTTVLIDVTVRYRINEEEADTFVTVWNNENQMERRLIRPTLSSDLRDEASDIQTSEIYTQEGREALTETAEASLREEFSDEPIVLEEVQIRNIDLPDSIDKALDRKEQAKQQVAIEQEKVKQEEMKKKQKIIRAEANAQQQIIQAKADAKAIRIQGEALEDNKIVLKERYIKALQEGNTIYVGESGITLTHDTNETDEDEGGE